MASYTVYIDSQGGKSSFLYWEYNNSTTGTGHTSSNPLDVQAGDTVTFNSSGSSAPGYQTISGLSIFTNNNDFIISFTGNTSGYPTSVTRTVASGNASTDSVTATHLSGVADTFYFYREIDDEPSGFVSGGWAGAATSLNTFYYASFQTGVTASTTSVGTYTVAGLSTGASVPISLALTSGYTATDADFSVNGATWYGPGTTGITVSNGNVIRWRVRSSPYSNTTARYTLTIGSVSKTLSIATAPDRTPNNFSFTTQTDVNLNSTITSNLQNITGIDNGTTVSVSNGEVQVGTNSFTSLFPPSINNNETIRVRHTSSSSNSTSVTTSVTVGTMTRTFTSTTVGASAPVVNNSQTGASGNVTTFLSNFQHQISLSQQGQGGTLEYNVTYGDASGGVASTTPPTSGWSTSPYVTVYRGRRHHFWARRSSTLIDRTDINVYVPYIYGGGAFTVSPSNRDVTSSDTSTTFNISYTSGSNLSSNHIIDIIVDTTATTLILGSRTGEGTITVSSSTTGWPSQGGTTSFYAWTRLPTALGGNNTRYKNTSTLSTINFPDTDPSNPVLRKADGTYSISETEASTSTYYYRKFNTEGISSGTNITWTASGDGRLSTSQYGTYSTTVTRQLNQTAWLRLQSSANAGTTKTSTVSTTGASATFTLTTAGSGGSSGSGDGGTADYGLAIYNANGNEILGPTHRSLGLIHSDSTGSISDGTSATLSAPGMNANNGDEIVIVLPASFSASVGNNITFTRGTNQFTLTNNSGSTVNTTYYIVRA